MSIDRIPSFYIQHQLKLVINILSVLQIVVLVIHTMICESHFTYNLNDDIESCLMMTSLEKNGGFYLVSIQLIYSFKKLFFFVTNLRGIIYVGSILYIHKDDDKKRKRNICIAIHFQKNNRH
jgi:hypothetical protein